MYLNYNGFAPHRINFTVRHFNTLPLMVFLRSYEIYIYITFNTEYHVKT